MKKYKIIYADPPWRYARSKVQGAAEKHYPTMSIEELCALPVKEIADKDCILFLWATFPQLKEALQLIKAWGFTYKSVAFVWLKQNRKSPTWFYGLGFWTRGNAEICLLATKGHPNLVVLKRTKMPAVLIEAGFINDDEDNRIFDENFNKIAQAIADGILKTLYAQDINFNEIPDYVQNMPEPEAFNGTYQGDAQDTTLPPSPATRPGMNVPYRMQNPMEDNDPEKLYRVQVGSFRDKSNAERMLNSLLMEGFPAFMIYEDGLYKVQVGAFRYLSNAIKMERRLRCFHYSTFIVYN